MGLIAKDQSVYLIVNPHSGYGGHHAMLGELRAVARAAGRVLTEHITTGPADATDYARQIADRAGAVVVWGGDGTVNEVANALAGTNVPILPCPVGTENLLAKELRIPSRPRDIIRMLDTGWLVNCDVGKINGRNFLLTIGVGFDGEVVRRLSAWRTGHISHLSYFWPIWRTFWEHDFPRLRIVADGEEIFDDFGLAFVGNISRYAVGLRICRDAVFDDGRLDLVIFTCRQQTRLVLHAAWTLLRRHPLKGNVIYRKFQDLHVESDRRVVCQVDGDLGPVTPLHISVSGKQIRLLIPGLSEGMSLWPLKFGDIL